MKLLLIVLNSAEKLEEVLEGLIETGVTGATVVDSVGMGHIMEDVPLFALMARHPEELAETEDETAETEDLKELQDEEGELCVAG